MGSVVQRLQTAEPRIEPPFRQQGVMRPAFNNPAILHDKNHVGIPNGCEPVRDDKCRTT